MRALLLCALLVLLGALLSGCGDSTHKTPADSHSDSGSVFLVESIPYNQSLELTPGSRNTWEVLTSFVNDAKAKIDFTVMYWDLLATNKKDQKKNFTPAEFVALGADKGKDLLDALEAAAKRGVKLRVLNGKGIESSQPDEIENIKRLYPDNVEIQVWNAADWYDSGIMHQKFWIFDDVRVYLGSANMDWLSLTQVKEIGVALDGSSGSPSGFLAAQDLQKLFDRWWLFTSPTQDPSTLTASVWDMALQGNRKVPCWEGLPTAPHRSEQCKVPFPAVTETKFNSENLMPLVLNGTDAGSFFSCSPPAICDKPVAVNSMYGPKLDGRLWDGDALIQTIMSANLSVCLSVMDYIPATVYQEGFAPAYWPALSDALIAKLRQGAQVRMLISHWAHSREIMWQYLHALNVTAHACSSGDCKGSLEIRLLEIPGWNLTAGPEASFPPFSRVNHAKYIVTDERFNIGTSNMIWGYFANTAGTSFNSNHAGLRAQLQAVFDRDWSSAYASSVLPHSIGQCSAGSGLSAKLEHAEGTGAHGKGEMFM